MSKKFFSLLHGEAVHIAPNEKVIPAKAFSEVISSKEVISKVQADADQYRQEVTDSCEEIKEQAKKEGFEQGFSQWTDAIAKLEAEIVKVREETEKVIIPIALKAAKKILGRELKASTDALIDIIENSLKAVSQHKKITILVNPKELEVVEKNRDTFKKVFENLEVLSVRPRNDVEPGGCVIETEAGIINAQLENQWLILENAFERLLQSSLKNKKEEKEG